MRGGFGMSAARAVPAKAVAWFALGVLPADGRAPDLPGVAGEGGLQVVPGHGVAALACPVARAPFDRTSPAHRAADPDWIAARVAAYHAANAAAAAAGPFLPLAFGTLFSSRRALGVWLAGRAPALRAGLRLVAGRAEWRLALAPDGDRLDERLAAGDPALRRLAAAVAAAGPGAGYLLSRRLEQVRAEARARWLAEAGRMVAEALADLGAPPEQGWAAFPEPARDGMPAWSVLAPLAGPGCPDWSAPLDALAAGLAGRGLALRATGPWPAYAFARATLSPAHG